MRPAPSRYVAHLAGQRISNEGAMGSVKDHGFADFNFCHQKIFNLPLRPATILDLET